jgi:hypothetical protein
VGVFAAGPGVLLWRCDFPAARGYCVLYFSAIYSKAGKCEFPDCDRKEWEDGYDVQIGVLWFLSCADSYALTGCPLLNEPVNGGTVPDVAGMPRVEAAAALADAGYTVGVVTEEESATITAGSVISQDPAAGTEAEPGTAVDLVVAAAPDDDDDGGGNTLGDVTVDTTLKAGEYRVEEDVQVTNDATLTLEAGVKLVFDQGHVLSVENSGKLESQGTAGNPVVLTGKEKTAGYWGGVRFYNTNSAANRLEYTIIEYGGG